MWQSLSDQDLRNRLITGMLSSTVEDTRFMLEAALGLVKDSLRGTMTGVGRGFRVSFVEQIGVGLTLKEVLAITYDALSDKDHLASTSESDLISSFHQLIVHLYQTKREYNDDTTPEGRLQADDNKCTGGAMNHIVHSLQGINDLVDVPVNLNLSVIKIEAKCHAINFIKRDLSTVDGLRDAVSRARTGAKFSELLPPYYKELLEKTKVEIRSMHDDHFKDDKYLEVVEDTLSNDLFIGNSALEAELGPLDYSSLFTPNDMAQAMIHRVLPLYTKTDQGYRYTFQLIYEQNPDNANSIAILCLDQQQYQAVVDYRIFASLDMAQLATQSPNLKAQILRFAIVNRDIKTARDLINGMSGDELATQDGRGKTALHVTVQVGNAELAGLVMHKMNKNQLVIQDKNENTALYYAVWNNCFDIAKLLIDGMSSEQLGLQDNKGRTLLHICVYCSKYEMAALLISKMNGEQLAVKNQAGETALKVMNDCVFIPQQIELILLMLDKMNDEQIALPDQRGMNFFHYMRAMHPTVVTALIAKLPVNYWLSEANRLIRGDEETNEILYWNNINDLIIADALLHDQHHSACEVMRKVVTVFPLETISEAVHLKIAIYLNSENKYGVSNFRKIIKSGDSEMVKIALAYGADPLSSRGSSTMTDMADSLAAANSTPERESIRNSVKDASTNPSYLKGGYIGMIERNQVMCRARHR